MTYTVAGMQMNLTTVCITHVVFSTIDFLNADIYEGDTSCVCFLLVTKLLNVVSMNLKLRSVNVLICEFFGFWRDVFDGSVLQKYGTVSLGNWFLTFLDNSIVSKCQEPFAH